MPILGLYLQHKDGTNLLLHTYVRIVPLENASRRYHAFILIIALYLAVTAVRHSNLLLTLDRRAHFLRKSNWNVKIAYQVTRDVAGQLMQLRKEDFGPLYVIATLLNFLCNAMIFTPNSFDVVVQWPSQY